jgi:hypothetical protein
MHLSPISRTPDIRTTTVALRHIRMLLQWAPAAGAHAPGRLRAAPSLQPAATAASAQGHARVRVAHDDHAGLCARLNRELRAAELARAVRGACEASGRAHHACPAERLCECAGVTHALCTHGAHSRTPTRRALWRCELQGCVKVPHLLQRRLGPVREKRKGLAGKRHRETPRSRSDCKGASGTSLTMAPWTSRRVQTCARASI